MMLRKQACFAALGLAAAVREFRQTVGRPDLAARIGVHAGQMYLGNIGAGDHYKYGPTGDTVNTASRMEGLNKFLGTGILVSAEVLQGINQFLVREAGSFRLKGKAQAVTAYELICHIHACKQKEKEAVALFGEALRAFKNRSWDEAEEKLQGVIQLCGDDKLSRFYIERCAAFRAQAPADDWEGVVLMEEK
jgi:adenylate cyclase